MDCILDFAEGAAVIGEEEGNFSAITIKLYEELDMIT